MFEIKDGIYYEQKPQYQLFDHKVSVLEPDQSHFSDILKLLPFTLGKRFFDFPIFQQK